MESSLQVGTLVASYTNYEEKTSGKYLSCDGRLITSSTLPELSKLKPFGYSVGKSISLPSNFSISSNNVNTYKFLNGQLFALGWFRNSSNNVFYGAIWRWNNSSSSFENVLQVQVANNLSGGYGFTDMDYYNGKYVAVSQPLLTKAMYQSTSGNSGSWTEVTGFVNTGSSTNVYRVFHAGTKWYVNLSNGIGCMDDNLTTYKNIIDDDRSILVRKVGEIALVFRYYNNQTAVTMYNNGSYVAEYTGYSPVGYVSEYYKVGNMYYFIALRYESSYDGKKFYQITYDSTKSDSSAITMKQISETSYIGMSGVDIDNINGKFYMWYYVSTSGTESGVYIFDMVNGDVERINKSPNRIVAGIINTNYGLKAIESDTIYSDTGEFKVQSKISSIFAQTQPGPPTFCPIFAFNKYWIGCNSGQGNTDTKAISLINDEFVLPNKEKYYIKVKE